MGSAARPATAQASSQWDSAASQRTSMSPLRFLHCEQKKQIARSGRSVPENGARGAPWIRTCAATLWPWWLLGSNGVGSQSELTVAYCRQILVESRARAAPAQRQVRRNGLANTL